jgi:competence protein ComEC
MAWQSHVGVAQWLLAGVALAALSTVVALRLRAAPAIAAGCAGVVAGLLMGGLFWGSVATQSRALLASGAGHWFVTVTSDPAKSEFGISSAARIVSGPFAGARVRVMWPAGRDAPLMGQRVELYGQPRLPTRTDAQASAFAQGLVCQVKARIIRTPVWESSLAGVAGRVRLQADERLRAVPDPAGGLLASALLGERWRIAETPEDIVLRDAGLAHFESTSGFHVMLFAGVVESLLLGLSLGRGRRAIVQAALVGAFVLLGGGHIAPLRSWSVGLVSGAGGYLGRRADPLASLAAIAAFFEVLWPPAVFELGFQLSVIGVAGIVVFGRLVRGWLAETLPWRMRPAIEPLATTICAVAATLPLTAAAFGVISPIAPVANVAAMPLVLASSTLGLVGLGIGVVWRSAGEAILMLAGAFERMLCAISAWLTQLPGAVLPAQGADAIVLAAWLASLASLWALWPQPERRRGRKVLGAVSACMLVWLLMPPASSGPQIVVMDVGQGDAILVRDGPHSLLIDTGPDARHLLPALARNHVRTTDGVVITHLHADHIGGLRALARVEPVPRLFFPLGTLGASSTVVVTAEAETRASPEELADGDRLRVGRIELEVLSPHDPVPDANKNAASVVMVAREGSSAVLLTGDAEAPVLEQIASRGRLPSVDVLKVGHHGSAITVDDATLSAMRPAAAAISVGAENRYGHPKPAALAFLRRFRVPVFRTDQSGDITIRFTPAGCRVGVAH